MSRGVIVIYRPKKGKDAALLQLVKDHMSILRTQDLVTERATHYYEGWGRKHR